MNGIPLKSLFPMDNPCSTLKTVGLTDREGMWTCSLLFCLLMVSWTPITHGSLKTSMLCLIVRLALNSTINFTVPISFT